MRRGEAMRLARALLVVITAVSPFLPAVAHGQTADEQPAPSLPLVPTYDATRPPSSASATPTLPHRTQMHSPGLIVGGVVLLVAAAASLGVSGYYFIKASHHAVGEDANDTNSILAKVVGIPMLLHGLGCAVSGGAMIVIGNRPVPAWAPSARVTLQPSLGASWGARVSWSF